MTPSVDLTIPPCRLKATRGHPRVEHSKASARRGEAFIPDAEGINAGCEGSMRLNFIIVFGFRSQRESTGDLAISAADEHILGEFILEMIIPLPPPRYCPAGHEVHTKRWADNQSN